MPKARLKKKSLNSSRKTSNKKIVPNRVFIDVREPEEYASGHVEGALNIPPAQLLSGARQLADIPKDTELVLYCRTGSRSAVAENIMIQNSLPILTLRIKQLLPKLFQQSK